MDFDTPKHVEKLKEFALIISRECAGGFITQDQAVAALNGHKKTAQDQGVTFQYKVDASGQFSFGFQYVINH